LLRKASLTALALGELSVAGLWLESKTSTLTKPNFFSFPFSSLFFFPLFVPFRVDLRSSYLVGARHRTARQFHPLRCSSLLSLTSHQISTLVPVFVLVPSIIPAFRFSIVRVFRQSFFGSSHTDIFFGVTISAQSQRSPSVDLSTPPSQPALLQKPF